MRHPGWKIAAAHRSWTRGLPRPLGLGMLALGLLMLLAVPQGTSAQTRTGESSPPGTSTETAEPVRRAYAAKKPKKMRQAKRERIKAAKIKQAVEFETPPGGTERRNGTTDYDDLGNALKHARPQGNNGEVTEEYTPDAARDVITKAKFTSSVVVPGSLGGGRYDDVTESTYDYEEADFEDGKDHLLKKVRTTRGAKNFAEVEQEYDESGRLKRIVQSQAVDTNYTLAPRSEVGFTYGTGDQPVEVVAFDVQASGKNPSGRRVISRQKRFYDANGLLIRLETWAPDRDSSVATEVLTMIQRFEYDSNSNMTSQRSYRRFRDTPDTSDVLVAEETHTYDTNGNETETLVATPVPLDPTVEVLPPPSERGTGQSKRTTRTFDSFGNVLTESTVETFPGQPAVQRSKRYDYVKFP